jgi:D-3-phosphoglycerate dehydrogenase
MKVVQADCGWQSTDVERRFLPPGTEVAGFQCSTEAESAAACRDADAVLAEYAPLTREVLRQLERCRIISISGIGVDNVDLAAATELGIVVTNVPGYCSHEVADHTLALLLAAARNIITCHRRVGQGDWDIGGLPPMFRLQGQVLGLAGFGRIAQEVAVRAAAFGLAVLAYDPYVDPACAQRHGVRVVGIEQLLEESDWISCHLPANGETFGFFDREKFARMRKHPVFINTSRGKVVVQRHLVQALKEGWIRGACLDVLEQEPPSFEDELFRLDNVIITPHVGFLSETAVEEVRRRAALNVTHFFQGCLPPENIINKEIVKKP